ncbi:hypothetical protein DRN87_04250 [Candidatus Geothermarchaeota archaeon]|nr:MAG: hypothetical protein DRN87_04250 [Candidatus Geothermarchaeota archaeon]
MLTPYEVVVKTALPAIRSILVRELYNRYGYKQLEIASKLYITQAAVSYYLTESRGRFIDELMKYEDFIEKVHELAREIHEDNIDVNELILRISDLIFYLMKNRYLCDLHKIIEPSIDVEKCTLCPIITRKYNI